LRVRTILPILALTLAVTAMPLASAQASEPDFVYGGAEVTRWHNDRTDPNINLAEGRILAHFFNGIVVRYLRAMAEASCQPGNPSACEAMIRSVAGRYGVDPSSAVSVARCESGLNPSASNGGSYLGLFQQSARYWPGRASAYGYGGASAFNGRANASVSMGMVRDGGWGAWECRP
jgi:hypothetical protein